MVFIQRYLCTCRQAIQMDIEWQVKIYTGRQFCLKVIVCSSWDSWRASEVSKTLSGLFNRESRYICHSTYVTFAH